MICYGRVISRTITRLASDGPGEARAYGLVSPSCYGMRCGYTFMELVTQTQTARRACARDGVHHVSALALRPWPEPFAAHALAATPQDHARFLHSRQHPITIAPFRPVTGEGGRDVSRSRRRAGLLPRAGWPDRSPRSLVAREIQMHAPGGAHGHHRCKSPGVVGPRVRAADREPVGFVCDYREQAVGFRLAASRLRSGAERVLELSTSGGWRSDIKLLGRAIM